MLNLTQQEFQEMLIESDKRIEEVKLNLTNVQLEIGKVTRKGDGFKKDLKKEEERNEAIEKAIIIRRGVPTQVSQMRNKLLRKMGRAEKEDITIAEKKGLDKEVQTLQEQLQKICRHPFVYDRAGYQGSPSDDYEDGYPGHRYCIVCGFSEDSHSSRRTGALELQREYLFKLLITDIDRIIEREPFRPWPESKKKIDIWTPLGVALSHFKKSVVDVFNS